MKYLSRIFYQGHLIAAMLLISVNAYSQDRRTVRPDSLFSTYYHQRVTHFKQLPQSVGDIIFLGNSITDGAEWGELFGDLRIKNRGISGDITAGVLNRLEEVASRKPSKIFLLIGVNDLARGIKPDSILRSIFTIVNQLRQRSPATKLYIQSLLPVNPAFGVFKGHTDKTSQINEINSKLLAEAHARHYIYIDLNHQFKDAQGLLQKKLTNDGLHLTGDGYLLWKHLVFPYVYDLSLKPALIPSPSKIRWQQGFFSLYQCKTIVVNTQELNNEARCLQQALQKMGYNTNVKKTGGAKEVYIELELVGSLPGNAKERYELQVDTNKILIRGNSAHAIFNGVQTLLQLARNGITVDVCKITDEPAFPWRGYMIDVGRNYVSVDLLKEQIDIMSKYKLNVFHFHATEDIAWRIASRQYPQLTAPEFMLRNKGMYYTEQDMKALIAYCKERHIVFVPEIDMPGHSAAFRRAMKTDMQSDSGIMYVKNIVKEFCETYDVPYIHIGADEVKITNQRFVPEITRYIENMGKKVIGWQPGGNFTNSTWRQLWMDDNAHTASLNSTQVIDSRHLYLNHMDPLEAVVTLFNRKIGDKNKADASLRGATLCVWHDRAARDERDILTMNPVYPGMLAFSERVWNGGGISGWVSNISDGDETAFKVFEDQLLDHKKIYFKDKPFPYVSQSHLKWKLMGPYDNKGDISQIFSPEKEWKSYSVATDSVTGGTVVMRHWWAPKIKGAIENPMENTTWYAATRIWSDEDGEKDFWIGFNNLSRSPATDSPPAGAWDSKGSKLWVRGNLIDPPIWNRPSQKGNSEIPLTDEGYEYRPPTKVALNKGWNNVLIKLPVTTFKGKDWQNPVKWMFTFVPVN